VTTDHIFALDFDGVLCDSVHESAVTAWRAGRHIWPQGRNMDPPDEFVERFVKLRPVVETGYQTLLLMGLIGREPDDAIIMAQFPELSAQLLKETNVSAQQCARWFGEARDAWIAEDLAGWLSHQGFYPRAMEKFKETLITNPVFIVTTKQERFVAALLKGWDVAFPRERILGLERGKPKEAILEGLLAQPQWQAGRWHFVEDRLETLLRVADHKPLAAVHLYLADWGYNTEAARNFARQHPSITVWNQKSFLVVQ
jgi:phosphoglycolate phosphatase-like HAD superfamily hydrolase